MKPYRTTTDFDPAHAEFVSVRRLSALVGITPNRLRELARDGTIPRLILGHRTHVYPLQEVLQALKCAGDSP